MVRSFCHPLLHPVRLSSSSVLFHLLVFCPLRLSSSICRSCHLHESSIYWSTYPLLPNPFSLVCTLATICPVFPRTPTIHHHFGQYAQVSPASVSCTLFQLAILLLLPVAYLEYLPLLSHLLGFPLSHSLHLGFLRRSLPRYCLLPLPSYLLLHSLPLFPPYLPLLYSLLLFLPSLLLFYSLLFLLCFYSTLSLFSFLLLRLSFTLSFPF